MKTDILADILEYQRKVGALKGRGLTTADRYVLVILISHFDGDKFCSLSRSAIVKETGLCRRQVNRSLKKIMEMK